MNGKLSFAIAGSAFVLLAVTAVTAHSFIDTPLYTVRMEQASTKMGFLPTEWNDFIYITEKGYTLNYTGYSGLKDEEWPPDTIFSPDADEWPPDTIFSPDADEWPPDTVW